MEADPQCRQKRIALGLPYPRSSCEKCGSLIRVGWKCAEEAENLSRKPSLEDRVGALEERVTQIERDQD